ncbi:uncharacterized protein LOC142349585 isoform X1 [Convolutriloba macropyga]|uniref:uncharacterized protein LOC142349585 isoform X1 n=1 Tax=Convolutriloba macropyga TaxID=536237 RepID=UPI003F5253DD
MERFDWPVGLYCAPSGFCGLGLDQFRDWSSFVSSAVQPVGEMCRVIVDVVKNSCYQFMDILFHTGILRKATWSCLLKGAKYCHLKLLRECSDVFGGFQCTKCLNGSIPDTQDDKKCKVVYEWSEWDDTDRVTDFLSPNWLVRNITRRCWEAIGGNEVDSSNCNGDAGKFAISYYISPGKENWEEVFWNCIGKGAEYCQLNQLRQCSDVFGGFQCGECLTTAVLDPQDDKRCIATFEWSNWDENNLVTDTNSATALIKNAIRTCVNLVTGAEAVSSNCTGLARREAVRYTKWLDKKNWNGAQQQCINHGGNVFDGTTASVSLSKELCLHFGAQEFWTSIGSNPNDDKGSIVLVYPLPLMKSGNKIKSD